MAATTASRPVVGSRAARIDDAARPTPIMTSAHEPVETRAAVIMTRVAVIIPVTAMKARAALPAGCVAQPLTV